MMKLVKSISNTLVFLVWLASGNNLVAQKTHSDNGDGTYTNPVIAADFPDPDVILVNDTYYMVTTTMFIFPGVTILKSKDLVNWEYGSNAVPRFDFSPCYNLDGCMRYGHGQWATSLKYNNGTFYLLFITLDEGGFLCSAEKAEGPWKIRKLPKGFYDPGLFFDEDGRIYVAHGYGKISVTELDEEFAPRGRDSLVYTGDIRKGLEGAHVYKIKDYYYLYCTYGGLDGIQVALRSKNIYGPYEQKVVLRDTTPGINFGIHQGALIKTQTAEWWTMLFVDRGPFGRFPSLQPVTWVDGWPMVGVDGKGVITYKKPDVGKEYPIKDLPVSDEFNEKTPGIQWGWNHNPDSTRWSLTQRPGHLRLTTVHVVQNLREARNTLTQRPFASYDQSLPTVGVTKLETGHMKDGDIAGLAIFQDPYGYIAVKHEDGAKQIIMVNNGETIASAPLSGDTVYLRMIASNSSGKASFEYGFDNKTFTRLGNELSMKFNLTVFTGNKFCLFNYATKTSGGYVDFDWFRSEVQAQSRAKITVDVDKPGHAISPVLFGVFFEDINLSADGGIYPELVRNRSFEDADTLQNWKFISADGKSSASISTADVQARPPIPPLNPFNRKSLFLHATGSFKLENYGYWGMNMVKGNSYSFTLAVRSTEEYNAPLKIRIMSAAGEELASGEIKDFNNGWKYFSLNLSASGSDPNAYLEISGEGVGKLYLDMVSLMPVQTWKNHGLRGDLAGAIDALHPKFLRFPGGCWVEGDDFAHMNQWKNTIGNIDTRTSLWNIWGYNATHGLGYHEYLQLAEDLGAEPLFCINAGMSHKEVVPMDQMGQWVQDALDAIEYANGPETSVWGSLRVKNGHPKPFNLKYIEIGNENGQAPYAERWQFMANAILAKFPEIKLIANEWAGSHPKDPMPGIIDEHYYNNPDWFIWNANKYDSYDRNGPKIFIGEYAVTSNTGKGNLRGAIGEAAWMTGMERNSDIVVMGSYAPLYCNANHRAWPVNLINYDSYRWYGLPGYYVQHMFANNQGTVVLPVKIENAPTIEAPYPKGCIGLGTWNNAAEFKEVKVTLPDGRILFKPDFSKIEETWRKTGRGDWSVKDSVLKQSAIAQGVTIFMGDTTWTDYTITLKARKIIGENGFQIYFHNRSNRERIRWDLGGYNNSVHRMEIGVTAESIEATIEPDCWYDVRIEIHGNSVKGYLNGKLVQEVSDTRANVSSLCASASRDDKSGDIILKVVNASTGPVNTQIALEGATNLTGKGEAIVLASAGPLDENTLEEPNKVSPRTETVKISGATLTRSFPGNSLTVIRLATSQ